MGTSDFPAEAVLASLGCGNPTALAEFHLGETVLDLGSGGGIDIRQVETPSAGLSCQFHDLRHTACRRMPESGTPLSAVATIMGWSPSTTVRMSRRYGHIGQAA